MDKRINPKLVLLLGAICGSAPTLISKFSEAPALIICTYRLIWTVLYSLPVLFLYGRKELAAMTRKGALMCGLSGMMLAMHFVLLYGALKLASVAVCMTLLSTEVLFAALGFTLFLKGYIPPAGIGAIVLAFAGSILLALSGGFGQNNLGGVLMALASAVFSAVYILIGRVQRGHMSTTVYISLTFTACLITLLLLVLFTGTPFTGYGPELITVSLLITLFGSLLGHSIFSWCLKYLSPSYVSSFKLCGPVLVAPLAYLLLGQTLGPLQLVGGAITILGVLFYTRVEREQPVVSPPLPAEELAPDAPQIP